MAIFLDTFSFKEYISSTVQFINWLFSLLDLSPFNVLYWLDLCDSRDIIIMCNIVVLTAK